LKYDALVCDIDGVIRRGRRVIWENVEVLLHLQGEGKVIRFITNSSSRLPEDHAEMLRTIGFEVKETDIITSGKATALYLQKAGIKKAYIVGTIALRVILKRHSVQFSPKGEVVVVGMDPNFNYRKLKRASSLIYEGTPFIATNPDASLPVEGGVLPGAGSIVAAISVAAGKKPDVVVGKPNPIIFKEATYDLKGKMLFIGDRLNTDIAGGNFAGLDTLLVLTGVHTLHDVEEMGIEPTFWISNLKESLSEVS